MRKPTPPESNAPKRVNTNHMGRRVIFKLPNQAVISEGEINEISPEHGYFRVGKAWLENKPGAVLAILSKSSSKKRSSPFGGKQQ